MILRSLARLIFFGSQLLSPAWAGGEAPVLPPPIAADLPSVLTNRAEAPVVFSYQGRPAITVIDFPSLGEQGRMFNRLVALIERIGAPRSRVLSNEELASFIKAVGKTEATLAYGNDFLVYELVVFFNLAELGGIELNAEELALRQHLLDHRFMMLRNGFFQALAPSAVFLSIPQEKPAYPGSPAVSALARQTILVHELSHAEYYTNPDYANHCRRFWRSELTDSQRAAFRGFLAKSGYDPDNEEMMINETQAYLMHTPDPRAFSPRLLGLSDAVVAQLRMRFRAAYPTMTYYQ